MKRDPDFFFFGGEVLMGFGLHMKFKPGHFTIFFKRFVCQKSEFHAIPRKKFAISQSVFVLHHAFHFADNVTVSTSSLFILTGL